MLFAHDIHDTLLNLTKCHVLRHIFLYNLSIKHFHSYLQTEAEKVGNVDIQLFPSENCQWI